MPKQKPKKNSKPIPSVRMRSYANLRGWCVLTAERQGQKFCNYMGTKTAGVTAGQAITKFVQLRGFGREDAARGETARPIRLIAPGGWIAAEFGPRSR
jgi:hypothetical protein